MYDWNISDFIFLLKMRTKWQVYHKSFFNAVLAED